MLVHHCQCTWADDTNGTKNFEAYMKYLKLEDSRVIALRDLQEYVDPKVIPADDEAVIEARRKPVEAESRPQ